MTFDNRPGGLDGPPAPGRPPFIEPGDTNRRQPKTWHKIVGWCIIGPPILLVATLSLWAVAWLFAHFPS